MPPQKGYNRPRMVLMDEEATSASHAPFPQGDPQFPPKFSIPPMPQAGFFPPMTSEAFQAFTNCWYAQT